MILATLQRQHARVGRGRRKPLEIIGGTSLGVELSLVMVCGVGLVLEEDIESNYEQKMLYIKVNYILIQDEIVHHPVGNYQAPSLYSIRLSNHLQLTIGVFISNIN